MMVWWLQLVCLILQQGTWLLADYTILFYNRNMVTDISAISSEDSKSWLYPALQISTLCTSGSAAASSSAAADTPRVPSCWDGRLHGSCPAAATSGGDPGRQAREGSHQGTPCRCASKILCHSKVIILHYMTNYCHYSCVANIPEH